MAVSATQATWEFSLWNFHYGNSSGLLFKGLDLIARAALGALGPGDDVISTCNASWVYWCCAGNLDMLRLCELS